VIVTDANADFSIIGIDAGTYYLEEVKAPDGYNLLTDPLEVIISSTIEKVGDVYEITVLTIEVDGGAAEDGVIATGIVSMSVENNTGPKFPGTGGMGRTIILISGALIIGLCTLAFVVYKKKSALSTLNIK